MSKPNYSIFELEQISLITDRYPSMKTSRFQIGHYSSLERAEAEMMVFVEYDQNEETKFRDTFCYIIREWKIDMCCNDFVAIRTYLPDGSFYEENMADKKGVFRGRPENRMRFHHGDLVEAFCHDRVFLGIVASIPFTPKEVEASMEKGKKLLMENGHGKEEAEEFFRNRTRLDDSDDSYSLYIVEAGHIYVDSELVFPTRRKVSSRLMNILFKNLNSGY